MRHKIVYRAAAARDFKDIGNYSRHAWGTARTRAYLSDMLGQIDRIAENPMLGADAELPRPGLRKIASGSHLIYYRVTDSAVEIVRILHAAMDVAVHVG